MKRKYVSPTLRDLHISSDNSVLQTSEVQIPFDPNQKHDAFDARVQNPWDDDDIWDEVDWK